ncbi:hypothetical protein ES754_05060 [Psychrobacter frigidicola]|uniref:Uncharacterized protein n=1 Tax=Psychrobacter frigidicola TaxID=45611 RepID=A0A5C7A3U0_9GAMM|nr:hypothetical protein [Psychrobacter frigidicola]TXD98297.1 hypothetical protein ES754_05060 [Psychrobacter frigidicola]
MAINYQYKNIQAPTKVTLTDEQTAGHADHWRILTDDMSHDVPQWLQQMIEKAAMPKGLNGNVSSKDNRILLSEDQPCHINQVLAMKDGKPECFINAYPCVNGPYGLNCRIERVIVNENTHDAVLRLRTTDGSIIYAFDQLYTANQHLYQQNTPYFVNFSAWAHEITNSEQNEVIMVEDVEAIRYHRAFNDIVAANDGKVPNDLQEQIKDWQPTTKEQMEPVEINLGDMCAYLFGDTLGQEDEAWCQGQVLGKQETLFNGKPIILFDVVILREQDTTPFVVRMGAMSTAGTKAIQVNDYVQANIWLQAAIYKENQTAVPSED